MPSIRPWGAAVGAVRGGPRDSPCSGQTAGERRRWCAV